MHKHDEVFGLKEIDNPWSQMMADANSMGGGDDWESEGRVGRAGQRTYSISVLSSMRLIELITALWLEKGNGIYMQWLSVSAPAGRPCRKSSWL